MGKENDFYGRGHLIIYEATCSAKYLSDGRFVEEGEELNRLRSHKAGEIIGTYLMLPERDELIKINPGSLVLTEEEGDRVANFVQENFYRRNDVYWEKHNPVDVVDGVLHFERFVSIPNVIDREATLRTLKESGIVRDESLWEKHLSFWRGYL
jgi:hypothetical protein